MTKEKCINWFWDKYNSCYPVIHSDYPKSIFMFYDHQFIRKLKLSKISGIKVELPKTIKGICLFEIDWENKRFWYKYVEIYQFLYNNYNNNYQIIIGFIKDRLQEADKILAPYTLYYNHTHLLQDADKLTPHAHWLHQMPVLQQDTDNLVLQETDKLEILTPGYLESLTPLTPFTNGSIIEPESIKLTPFSNVTYDSWARFRLQKSNKLKILS